MRNPLYLFIDESGDPGDDDGTRNTTPYYVELVIHIESKYLETLGAHVSNWRYVECIIREPKILPKDEEKCKRFLQPFVEVHKVGAIKCAAVYLRKDKYNGPYLKTDDPIWNNRLRFRNFVHKQLLKHYFSLYPKVLDDYIVAVFDYYRMLRADLENVTFYLRDICEFPLDSIVHLNSKSSWVLQTAGQLANAVSQIPLGNDGASVAEMLSFVELKDITNVP